MIYNAWSLQEEARETYGGETIKKPDPGHFVAKR